MAGWYAALSRTERRTLWSCFAGWALDGMDVQIYTFLIPALSALWGMSKGEAGALATSALVCSSVGGWITGMLADRFGRVRMLQISILWFAFFTALSGLTNSFEQLLVVRGLQGLGFGGEWVAGAILIGETVAAKYRGRAVGFVQSGWAPGWGIAAIVASLALSYLPAGIGWRVVFFIGVTPALLVFVLRRFVPEPELFTASHRTKNLPLEIFSPALLRTTILCAMVSAGANGGYYAITTWLPTFLRQERGLTIFGSTAYLIVIITGSFAGYIAGAYLTDAIGRRKNLLLFAAANIVTVALYTSLPLSDAAMLALGFPLGFCACGIFSGIGSFFTELFPTRVRGAGQGFSFSFGRGIGAFNPTLVGALAATLPLGKAIGVFAVAAYGLLAIAALLLPETRGKALAD